MLVSGKNKFIISSFTSEDELKKLVIENPDYFFGTNSFCITKELFSDKDGFETITDGFAIDIANQQWFIVTTTLLANNAVWSQVAPQVARQLVFAGQITTKQVLVDLIGKKIREDKEIMKKFSYEGYGEGINGVFLDKINDALTDIFDKAPFIGMPIDSVTTDLNNWAKTLKAEVKLCIVKKYAENGNPENVIYEIPDESSPTTNTTKSTKETIKEAKNDTKSMETVPGKYTEKSTKDNGKPKEKASERFAEIEFL
ncbi:MAG: hypothetical protein GY936_14620 [Ignavibacteriae bacterium]|nr:hypothetical protein [Ignavibacteriota bacterium]